MTSNKMKNIAVILAGGTGARMGNTTPKQFLTVAGKMVIEHTIDVFESHPGIDEIAVVVNRLYSEEMKGIVARNGWEKVGKILEGGKERYHSTLAAIKAYQTGGECNLIIHDAVRPLLSHRIIDDIIVALDKYGAIDVAVPATDTIIQVDESGNFIKDVPNRKFLRRGQTPQAFHLSVIQEAYSRALQDPNLVCSDDCGIVLKYLPEERIFVVAGEEANMKLTYQEDTFLLEKLFQARKD